MNQYIIIMFIFYFENWNTNIIFCCFFPLSDLYVVEFQKRGLPHCHMLFWLYPEYKYHDPLQIDKIISAEIPNPIIDPLGHKIITEYMIHGPCGYAKTSAPCMKI